MKNLKVGVIIPYSIDRGWLNEAKESVRNQTYKNIALIDSQGNCSVGQNINEGAKIALNAGCDIIRYLCEDDMLTLNSVEDTVKFFTDNPDVDFMHGNAMTLYQDTGKELYYHAPIEVPTLEEMIAVNRLHGGTVSYRADIFREFQFDELLWTGEEYDFNMKIMKAGKRIGKSKSCLYVYRRHGLQKSLGNTERTYQLARKKAIAEIQARYK